MHLHLPKPLHGWREFAGEVGIIVIGVLIGLGSEQLVENFHQKAELRDAEKAMTAELRDDDLPQAFTRAAVYGCYGHQLDAIEQAVASGDRAKVLALAAAYKPVDRTWDQQAWDAAVSSQVIVHSGSKRLLAWSTDYVMIPWFARTGSAEQDELSQLEAKMSGKGPLSEIREDRLFQTISNLRRDNHDMTGRSLVFTRYLEADGLALTRRRKDPLLAEARKAYGSCVKEISPAQLNMEAQIYTVGGV